MIHLAVLNVKRLKNRMMNNKKIMVNRRTLRITVIINKNSIIS